MEQQKDKKRWDGAFVRLLLTSFLGIFLCIVCLCSTTYAWFVAGVQGGNNVIRASELCKLSVSVAKEGSEEAVIDIHTPTALVCEGTYTVTLTLPSGSASGYLVVSVGDTDYYTDYLKRSEGEEQTLTFTMDVKAATSVLLTARWGIYSGECHIENGEVLTVG